MTITDRPVTEVARILTLPSRTLDLTRDLTPLLRLPGSSARLRPAQSTALIEAGERGGLVGAIGVGVGKTLIAFLLATVMDCRHPVMLIPPSAVTQVNRMLAAARKHWRIRPPQVIPYSQISIASGTNLLSQRCPDLLICDEAHMLKDRNAARTKRVMRYMQEHPECRFVALSGTLTTKSVRDCFHLAALALREHSPLPRKPTVIEAWARVIDADSVSYFERDLDAIRPMVPGTLWSVDIARAAVKKRCAETEGYVVISGHENVAASLSMGLVTGVPYPAAVCAEVRSKKETPGGDPFESDIDEWRCLRQLALGFYYRWEWGEAGEDEEWLMRRRRWARLVREELDTNSRAGYDSPLLVAQRLQRAGADKGALWLAFHEWTEVRDRANPKTVAEWIDAKVPLAVVEAGRRAMGVGAEPMLVWYESDAVANALEAGGVRVIRAGTEPPFDGRETLALSIVSHGQGLNLQAWRNNIVLEPMADAGRWEQLLGRTHREGQTADVVKTWVAAHAPSFVRSLDKAKTRATYIEETLGTPQRLLFADWVENGPPPPGSVVFTGVTA